MPDTPLQSDDARTATVPDASAGRRFDAVLAELFPQFSRSRLTTWIKAGEVLLDGAVPRPRDPVMGGERVELNVVLDTQTEAEPQDIPLPAAWDCWETEPLLLLAGTYLLLGRL